MDLSGEAEEEEGGPSSPEQLALLGSLRGRQLLEQPDPSESSDTGRAVASAQPASSIHPAVQTYALPGADAAPATGDVGAPDPAADGEVTPPETPASRPTGSQYLGFAYNGDPTSVSDAQLQSVHQQLQADGYQLLGYHGTVGASAASLVNNGPTAAASVQNGEWAAFYATPDPSMAEGYVSKPLDENNPQQGLQPNPNLLGVYLPSDIPLTTVDFTLTPARAVPPARGPLQPTRSHPAAASGTSSWEVQKWR